MGEFDNIAQSLFTPVNIPQSKDPYAGLTAQEIEQRQLAKSMAGLEYSSIYPDLQNKYDAAKQDYLQFQMDAYKKNKGKSWWTGRPTLSPQDAITRTQKQNELMSYVGWGKKIEPSLAKTYEQGLRLIQETQPGKTKITPQDFNEWKQGWLSKVKNSKTGAGDVEDPYTSFSNMVAEKGQIVPPTEQQTAALEKGQRAERDASMKEFRAKTADILRGTSSESYSKHPIEHILGNINDYLPTDQAKNDMLKSLQDLHIAEPTDDVATGMKKWAEIAHNQEKTRTPQSFMVPGSPSAPTTFMFNGGSSVSLAAQSPPVKGNFDGKEVDGTVSEASIDADGNKFINIQQDKMIPVTRGANKGKMVNSGEKETVPIPVSQSVEKKLKDMHVIIDWNSAVKPAKQESKSTAIPDVTYTSSKSTGNFSRKDIIKNFVDSKGRVPTDKEWNDIVNQLGLKSKK